MIYELSLVAKPETNDADLAALKKIVHDVVSDHEGEILIEDDWGNIVLAQQTRDGVKNGRFVYFIFKANNANNKELIRRLKITETHMRHMFIALGEEEEREAIVKAYKTPFSKTYKGTVTDLEEENDNDGGPKKFSKRKTCYFRSNNIKADWKDPQTFNWLLNEFGKISAARVSGVSRKHQRFATTAIKRARQIGVASFVSNQIAQNR